MTGQPDERLAAVCPPLAAHVWEWFVELSLFRTPAYSGVGRLMPEQLRAWASMRLMELEQYEIDMLFDLEREFRAVMGARDGD